MIAQYRQLSTCVVETVGALWTMKLGMADICQISVNWAAKHLENLYETPREILRETLRETPET